MKRLTQNEIDFIKYSGVTPTVIQCDEWNRTKFANFDDADNFAMTEYGFRIANLINKTREDDAISLEYMATYLFYIFFTREELENLSVADGLEWLQNFKYFGGYRKWNEYYVEDEIAEAIEVYKGFREFYECDDGEIWNQEIGNKAC